MADTQLSNLSASGAVAATDIFYSVVTAGVGGVKATAAQLKTFMSASPTFVTPTLGVATATSINKVAITAPATSATLTIADGKTLTASNSIALVGTDSTVMTFPTTSATVARTDAANTFTGVQTFSTPIATASVASMTATVGGGVPTPPNDSTKFLNGQGAFTTPAGSGGLTIGTTTITSGTTLRLLYDNAGVVGESTITTDGTSLTIPSGTLTTSGNISAAAWTTNGLRVKLTAASYTDTSSSGTVATAYSELHGATTILASSATTYTNYFGTYFVDPVASTNVTMTNKWALGADSLKIGTGSQLTISTAGILTMPNNAVIGSNAVALNSSGITLYNAAFLGWNAAGSVGNADVVTTGWSRIGAQSIRFGLNSSASPLAYTVTIGESSRGGTDSNVGGRNGTIAPGLGTGTGTLAKLLLQGVVIAASGTTAQTYATAISINDTTSTGLQFPGYGLGAINSDASGNLTSVSDPRDKFIQRRYTAGLTELKQIEPIVYKWRPESGMETEHEYAGFDAQNVHDVMDLATGRNRDGKLSLSDRALLAACVNAIKELARQL